MHILPPIHAKGEEKTGEAVWEWFGVDKVTVSSYDKLNLFVTGLDHYNRGHDFGIMKLKSLSDIVTECKKNKINKFTDLEDVVFGSGSRPYSIAFPGEYTLIESTKIELIKAGTYVDGYYKKSTLSKVASGFKMPYDVILVTFGDNDETMRIKNRNDDFFNKK